ADQKGADPKKDPRLWYGWTALIGKLRIKETFKQFKHQSIRRLAPGEYCKENTAIQYTLKLNSK
ncbi:MAG: hypothetical protein U5R30_18135, partial [Deltaproteobacteria bacterium]|nr:hypothetical protein [Deltaproteobacteria bacterium]